MARTDNLNNFLTDVADSIREKKGTTELIPASEFDTEIDSISSGVDINDYWKTTYSTKDYNVNYQILSLIKKVPNISSTSSLTSASFLYAGLVNVNEINVTKLNTSNVTDFSYMFDTCRLAPTITGLDNLDFSKGTNFNSMFNNWTGRSGHTIDLSSVNMKGKNYSNMFSYNYVKNLYLQGLDFSNCINCSTMFSSTSTLVNLLFKENHNMGKGFLTSDSENYSYYTMSFNNSNNLTHDSLMSYINGLYDIKTAGVKAQKLVLGATNLAKLTSEEIAIATERGFNVS